MIGLTARQQRCLDFIAAYQAENGGVSPSFQQIADAIGLSAKSAVFRILDTLEKRGRIRRLRNRHQAIEIIDAPPVDTPPLSGFRVRPTHLRPLGTTPDDIPIIGYRFMVPVA